MDIVKAKGKYNLEVEFDDADGNLAEVDGAPKWSSTDDTLVSLAQAEDGMSCVAQFLGKPGTGKIQCLADADMTETNEALIGEYEFQVVAGKATIVKIKATEVVE